MVRGARGQAVAVCIGLAYAVSALLAGYMLEFARTGASGTSFRVLTNSSSPYWWNYPALVIVAPGGVLALPFFATVSMGLVSIGVGLGMAGGLIFAVRVYRSWKGARAAGGPASSLAGLTPAMVAVLTLGACCSTSAAAAGGIASVAAASGTTYDQILLNSWYLNVFQLVVLGIALLAQEQLLELSDRFLHTPDGTATGNVRSSPAGLGSLRAPAVAARVFLVVAGTLWVLSLLLTLATLSSRTSLAEGLVGGLLQHGLVGAAAVAAGLLPAAFLGSSLSRPQRGAVAVTRGLLLVGGVSIVIGTPPPLPGAGIYGLGNLILGAVGVPAGWGGVVPHGEFGGGVTIALGAVYAVLGVFAIVLALAPERVLRQLSGGVTSRVLEAEDRVHPAAREPTGAS